MGKSGHRCFYLGSNLNLLRSSFTELKKNFAVAGPHEVFIRDNPKVSFLGTAEHGFLYLFFHVLKPVGFCRSN